MFFDCFLLLEQILHNIKQEYKRLQKRRHLDSTFQQADACCPLDLQNIHTGSALAGNNILVRKVTNFYLFHILPFELLEK